MIPVFTYGQTVPRNQRDKVLFFDRPGWMAGKRAIKALRTQALTFRSTGRKAKKWTHITDKIIRRNIQQP
jgi:hypothetical protein